MSQGGTQWSLSKTEKKPKRKPNWRDGERGGIGKEKPFDLGGMGLCSKMKEVHQGAR